MSALIIDTNVYSGFMRGNAAITEQLDLAEEIHIPLIVFAELLAGFDAGNRAQKNRQLLSQFTALPRVHKLNPSEKTAEHYVAVYLHLRARGTPIPTNDIWIAALARQVRLPLYSLDAHFKDIPGVERLASTSH